MNEELFKYENGEFIPAPNEIRTETATISNPSKEILHKHGYWPKKVVEQPADEDGFKYVDRGVDLVDDQDNPGKKMWLCNKYDKLPVVDNVPEIGEDQEIYRDYWEEVDSTWKHMYIILNLVDPGEPELDEDQEIVGTDWVIDEAAGTKTKVYDIRRIVDNPPELDENQQIVNDYWEDDGTTKTHVYEVRTIVDNPPELTENQFIYEDHWDDDGETRTHVYDVWTLVDERPAEEEGKVIRDLGEQDDPDTKTRTHVYVVKTIVDEKPEDDPDGNFYYVFDHEEETDTEIIMVYRREDRIWRIFSKLSIESALFQMGKLDAFDEFIDSLEIENEFGQKVGLRRFYNQANVLKENHKFFKPYYAAALQALDLTPEQGEELLAACVSETDM